MYSVHTLCIWNLPDYKCYLIFSDLQIDRPGHENSIGRQQWEFVHGYYWVNQWGMLSTCQARLRGLSYLDKKITAFNLEF